MILWWDSPKGETTCHVHPRRFIQTRHWEDTLNRETFWRLIALHAALELLSSVDLALQTFNISISMDLSGKSTARVNTIGIFPWNLGLSCEKYSNQSIDLHGLRRESTTPGPHPLERPRRLELWLAPQVMISRRPTWLLDVEVCPIRDAKLWQLNDWWESYGKILRFPKNWSTIKPANDGPFQYRNLDPPILRNPEMMFWNMRWNAEQVP